MKIYKWDSVERPYGQFYDEIKEIKDSIKIAFYYFKLKWIDYKCSGTCEQNL